MKIAVAQLRSLKGDIETNLAKHCKLASLAAAQGVELLVFPELSVTGYEPTLAAGLATTPSDPRLSELQGLANDHGMVIGVGLPTTTTTGQGICITMVLLHPHRSPQTYSKKHLHADE